MLAAVVALAALPAVSQDLTDEALSQAASGRPGDLRDAAEKAARAKRLNPFAVAPAFAQASILERGNRPADALGVLIEAVDRQPDNPATWSRLARFQTLVDDSAGALRSLVKLISLDPGRVSEALLGQYLLYDERRSASATGTPLPEIVKRAPEPDRAGRARHPVRAGPPGPGTGARAHAGARTCATGAQPATGAPAGAPARAVWRRSVPVGGC